MNMPPEIVVLTDQHRCDHCGTIEPFNVLCPACEQLACNECGRVECCCLPDPDIIVLRPYPICETQGCTAEATTDRDGLLLCAIHNTPIACSLCEDARRLEKEFVEFETMMREAHAALKRFAARHAHSHYSLASVAEFDHDTTAS